MLLELDYCFLHDQRVFKVTGAVGEGGIIGVGGRGGEEDSDIIDVDSRRFCIQCYERPTDRVEDLFVVPSL